MQCDLEQVVREKGDLVLRLALAHTGNRADAEDVFQEVFIRLVRSVAKLESAEHLHHWLIRATINRCKSLHVSSQRQHETVVEELPDIGEEQESDTCDTPVIDALQSLPEHYRSVLHLFYFEELTVHEIATALDTSEGTIKSQLSRGRALLREALKEVPRV